MNCSKTSKYNIACEYCHQKIGKINKNEEVKELEDALEKLEINKQEN